MSQKKVIIVAGPTASGKTSLAITLARHYNTAIISADSRQCYRELNIGVARPSDAELAAAPHYFIASHSIKEEVTAATFEQYALKKTEELFQDNDTVIMAGGTGLYIKAFCEGLDLIPDVPLPIRQEIGQKYKEKGLGWLQQAVEQADPVYYAQGEIFNPRRLMRALEVKMSTGNSILHYQSGVKTKRNFTIHKLGIRHSRALLYERINERVLLMMQDGLLEEVRALYPYKSLSALQTVGYSELFRYLDGEGTLEEAVAAIQQNTRRYAKRQETWFNKDEQMKWLLSEDLLQIKKSSNLIEDFLF